MTIIKIYILIDATSAPHFTAIVMQAESTQRSTYLPFWKKAPRYPCYDVLDRRSAYLLLAILNQEPVRFIYQSGSQPGTSRSLIPAEIFCIDHSSSGPRYVTGWCPERSAHRTYRLDLMKMETTYQRVNIETTQ